MLSLQAKGKRKIGSVDGKSLERAMLEFRRPTKAAYGQKSKMTRNSYSDSEARTNFYSLHLLRGAGLETTDETNSI